MKTDEEKQQAYDDMRSDLESAECALIQDGPGSSYIASFCGRVIHRGDWQDCLDAINNCMEEEKFWPNIYSVNDHGNVSLHDSEGNVINSWV